MLITISNIKISQLKPSPYQIHIVAFQEVWQI